MYSLYCYKICLLSIGLGLSIQICDLNIRYMYLYWELQVHYMNKTKKQFSKVNIIILSELIDCKFRSL